MSASFISREASLLGLLFSHMALPLGRNIPSVSPSSKNDTSHIGIEPTHMAPLNLNYPFKGPMFKNNDILVC